jgi:hypothetical protein
MSEAVRTRLPRRGLLAVGIVLVVVAVLLAFVLPTTLMTYPGDGFRDTTVEATGTATLLVEPVTLAPAAQPAQGYPFKLQRRVHTLDAVDHTVVVEQDDAQSIANLPPLQFVQRYTIDDTTLRNVASSSAYAYSPAAPVDRAPAYSVAFPFGAGAGPYAVWNDQVGQPIVYNQTGTASVNGRTLVRYRGVLDHADIQEALRTQLTAAGLPSTTTLKALTPYLAAAGVDVNNFAAVVKPQLTTDDQGFVDQLLTGLQKGPIPLAYELSADTQLLVEPHTGVIVSMDRVDETLSARPDVAGIGRLYAVLTQPTYASNPDVVAAATSFARLLAAPPKIKVIGESYAQTPSSVAALTSSAGRWADQIVALTIIVPIVVGILGLLLCLAALWRGRKRHP